MSTRGSTASATCVRRATAGRVLRTILAERYYYHRRRKAQNKYASEALLHNHERVVMRESASQPGAGAGSSALPAPFLHD